MKLVATVKLQKAREKAEHTRPYSDGVYQTMQSILERSAGISHPYLQGGDNPRKAVIVMTSNRGLAGGYNANVVKLITQGNFDLKELDIYAVGKKGKDALQRGRLQDQPGLLGYLRGTYLCGGGCFGQTRSDKLCTGRGRRNLAAYTSFTIQLCMNPG